MEIRYEMQLSTIQRKCKSKSYWEELGQEFGLVEVFLNTYRVCLRAATIGSHKGSENMLKIVFLILQSRKSPSSHSSDSHAFLSSPPACVQDHNFTVTQENKLITTTRRPSSVQAWTLDSFHLFQGQFLLAGSHPRWHRSRTSTNPRHIYSNSYFSRLLVNMSMLK